MASVPNLTTSVLLRSEETGGHVSVTEIVVPPHSAGPPLHTHDFDEAFYMLEGKLIFQVDDTLVTKGAGELSYAPRNVAHALANDSDAPPKKDLSFVPLRPERVVEVRYDCLEGARFRHPPQFVRWRPDRDPASCGYAQLAQPTPFDVADALAGRLTS